MTADQFTFTIEATGDNAADAAKKLGLADGETSTTVKNNDGAAGAAVSVVGNPFENMIFDETDDGVTYTYTIRKTVPRAKVTMQATSLTRQPIP